MEKITLKVDGMSCEHCVKAVSMATSSLIGVDQVWVDLKSGTVSTNFDPAKSNLQEIKAAIEGVGYTVL